ncbi:MAG: hypothetical protein ACLFR2_09790 [Candidatus Kapaibacterium sp.]
MLGLNSCKEQSGTEPISEGYGDFDALVMSIPDADNSPAGVIDGTMDNEIGLQYETDIPRVGVDNNSRNGRRPGKGPGAFKANPLARILQALNLTDEQKDSVRIYLEEHKDCMTAIHLRLRASEKAMRDKYNETRRAIIDSAKSGLIERVEAIKKLTALNLRFREALRNNPARIKACEEMKACKDELFRKIHSLLDAEQQAMFEEWVSKLPEGCGKPGKGPKGPKGPKDPRDPKGPGNGREG